MANFSFKTTFRSLGRNKSFSLINIAGLGVGIAASLLIFLVINHERSYDQYHEKKDRIYRVVTEKINRTTGDVEEYHRGVPNPLPYALRNDITSFEKVSAISAMGEAQIYVPGKAGAADEKAFKENEGLFFAEPGIFEIFDYKWVAGSAKGLTAPHTGVIDQSLAEKYFGSAEAAIGKTIEFYSFRYKVLITGVFKDLPAHTDIPVRMGISFATMHDLVSDDFFTSTENWKWVNEGIQCFVLLPAGRTIATEAAQLPAFVKKYYPEAQTTLSLRARLQPLADMHLNHLYGTYKEDALSVKELWALGLIGAFLLLVACINFINLATAQSVLRSREIGVRKVLGSNRGQLIRQFLQETGILTLCALVLGIVLAIATLPLLSALMQKKLSAQTLLHPTALLFMGAIALLVTFLAGLYPALIVSGFKPAAIFRNKLTAKSSGGISLRRGLVVFQFVIAQLLVIGTIVVVKQMQYFRNRPMGIEKENIALIDLPSDSSLKVKYPLLKQQMQAIAGVREASLCWNAPVTLWSAENDLYYNNNPQKLPFKVTMQFGDTSFYRTFGIQLAEGRFPFHSDTAREFMVNETTVKQLGLASAKDIIGKSISFDGTTYFPVVGVLRDYNTRSLHTVVKPLAICSHYNNYTTIAVRMQSQNVNNTLAVMQRVFKDIYPTYLYDLSFFDQKIERLYKAEATTSQLFKTFAILAIFISCLGLYGLVAFMAVQKTKEVGIRKVLGASVQSIVYLFSREFTVLIVVAFLIAAPVGYYFMDQWLTGFYYHITIGPGIFLMTILFSVIIAWITVSYKALKAALVNPVKSLKTE